jgi:LmbE family N-acetylglucosaminyl deacetylase
MYASRVLILVPHPDDEVVGCLAAILRARRDGARIHAYYLSNGVPPRRGYPARVERRWREAAAARSLLGLADAGREDQPSRTLRLRLAQSQEGVARALKETRAEVLWTPAFEGGHQDHDAANALASRFAARLPVWEFSEYHAAGERIASQSFIAPNGTERLVALTREESAAKRHALRLYRSERANLRHVGRAQEAFRPLPAYDYALPPHPGTLFFARYRWVPWLARIDRTPPADVYRDLGAFARGALNP